MQNIIKVVAAAIAVACFSIVLGGCGGGGGGSGSNPVATIVVTGPELLAPFEAVRYNATFQQGGGQVSGVTIKITPPSGTAPPDETSDTFGSWVFDPTRYSTGQPAAGVWRLDFFKGSDFAATKLVTVIPFTKDLAFLPNEQTWLSGSTHTVRVIPAGGGPQVTGYQFFLGDLNGNELMGPLNSDANGEIAFAFVASSLAPGSYLVWGMSGLEVTPKRCFTIPAAIGVGGQCYVGVTAAGGFNATINTQKVLLLNTSTNQSGFSSGSVTVTDPLGVTTVLQPSITAGNPIYNGWVPTQRGLHRVKANLNLPSCGPVDSMEICVPVTQ